MRFQPAILGLLGLATSASAMINATQVASEINELSHLSSKANVIANNITAANADKTVPELVKGLHQMADTIESDIATIKGSNGTNSGKTVGKKRQSSIVLLPCSALVAFTTAEDKLFETLISKVETVSKFPGLTEPIAAALKVLDGAIESLAFGVLDSVPGYCAQEATENISRIDQSLETALEKYQAQ